MSTRDCLSMVLNYLQNKEDFNRITFGLSKSSHLYHFIRWRATDVLLLILLIVLYIWVGNLTPFERQFYVNDLTISHPFSKKERVNNRALFLYSAWMPLLIIFVIGIVVTKPKNKIYVTYVSLLGLCLSIMTTSVVTDILKNFIGRHRPDFLARCEPKSSTPKDVMVFAKDVCTTKHLSRLQDGFRTTPSGHSSTSFSGLLYLTLWLGGQLVATHELAGSWRTLVAVVPTLIASLIAISRTEDYRHHFVDVIIGSSIGIVISYWSYFRLFPSLYHRKSYEPIVLIKESAEEGHSESDIPYESIEVQDV